MAIYGVYERDQFVFEGTPQEVAKRLGVKIDTVCGIAHRLVLRE